MKKEKKLSKLDKVIETIIIVRDGKLGEEVLRNPYHSAFFMRQMVEYGLEGFHISVKSGISDDEKSEIIQETIDTWDNEPTEITDL